MTRLRKEENKNKRKNQKASDIKTKRERNVALRHTQEGSN